MRPTLPRSNRRPKRAKITAPGGPVAPEASYVARRSRVPAGARGKGTVFPRRRPHPVTRRAAFTLLIVASMALVTVSYRGGAVLHGAQLAALEVVAPIERGLSRAWDPIAGAWNWTGRTFSAANELPKLQKENAELRLQVRIAQENFDDQARRQRSLGFDDTYKFPNGYDRVWATVTNRVPGAVERSMVIDRGSSDGISVDDPVLVAGGLIGSVIQVGTDHSVVGLILDDSQRVSAHVTSSDPDKRSDAWGVLRTVSTEGTPTMQLRFVDQGSDVEVYDQVATSGFASRNGELRSKYPKGIPIGVVTSVGNDPAALDKTVQVTPYADFDRIDEVMVLVRTARSRDGGAE